MQYGVVDSQAVFQQRLEELERHLAETQRELAETQRELAETQQDLVACRSGMGDDIEQLKQQMTQMRSPVKDPDQDPTKSKSNEITMARLDVGHSYSASSSVWDACLFVGHPGIGLNNSFVLFLLWGINIFFQVFFVITLAFFVPIQGVDEGVLETLLRFRVGVAHSARTADPITQTSMIANICSENEKLHISGVQMSVLQDVRRFQRGGQELMYLAQLLWLFLIQKELENVWQFCRALLAKQKSKRTKIIIADSTKDSLDHDKYRANNTKEKALNTIMVAIRLESISYTRVFCAFLFIVVPRVAIGCCLGLTGMLFLAKTTTHAELVLNCLAFAFICDVDELLYDCFAPFRIRTLIHNLEPISTPRHVDRSTILSNIYWHLNGMRQVFKMGIVSAVLLALLHFELWPRFWRMNQVDIVLCGGDVDFIYSKNAANDILYVTKSSSDDEWKEDEKIVLQAAGIPLENDYWFSLEDEIMQRAYSSDMVAVPLPSTGLVEGGYTASNFNAVMQLEAQSLEEAAEHLGCGDLGTSATREVNLRALRLLTGNMSHTDCSNIPWQWCSSSNYSQLRALCPLRCNCHNPSRYLPGYSGFYQSAAGGCPGQCKSLVASFNEINHATDPLLDVMGYIPCTDVDPDKLIFQGACVDTDRLNNARASHPGGWVCSQYSVVREYFYDDNFDDFDWSGWCWYYDDTDWTGYTMCCACGGGATDVSTSASCAANLTDNCENMNLEAFSLVVFIRGVFEMRLATPGFEDAVTQIVMHPSNTIAIPDESKPALIEWVISGQMPQSILSGNWELMPGLPHPRNLTGCDFLTSFEFTALLNLDLCSTETYSSLKSLCPVSCGCTLGSFYKKEEGGESVYATEFFELLGYPGVSTFTNKPEDMAHCPASCVVPHPRFTGDTSFSNWPSYNEWYWWWLFNCGWDYNTGFYYCD